MNGPAKKPPFLSRGATLLLAGCGAAFAAALAAPYIRVAFDRPAPPSQRMATPETVPYLLLIGRRPERTHLHDPTPHRNSPIALYRRGKDAWHREEGGLMTRSTSTNIHPPREEDHRTVPSNQRQMGHHSVPLGVFSLVQVPWRDGNHAFRISDWGRIDGTISLPAPQTVVYVETEKTPDGGFIVRELSETLRSSWTKTGSHLHPTITERWSYGDSHGCINLHIHHPPEEGSDWHRFLEWLDSRSLVATEQDPLLLVVAPFDEVNGTGDELAETLPLHFYESIRIEEETAP